jgi:translocation and assembly module TamB
VVTLHPLEVDVLCARYTARGSVDMHPVVEDRSEPKVALTVNADGLEWQGSGTQASTPMVSGDADLRVTGTTDDWNARGTATLWRDGRSAQLRFGAIGDRKGANIDRLSAEMPTGTLQGSGRIGWTPSLAWTANATLDGFDPGYFLPDWNGAVNGSVATTGRTRADDGIDMRFDLQKLGGRLRGRALAGHGTVGVHTAGRTGGSTAYEGDIDLRLGGSHLEARGEIAQRLDVKANFSPLRLDDLLPDASGTLRGTLVLGGSRNAPDVAANLDGNGIAWNDWRADTLHARGKLPWHGRGGALTVDASGLQAGVAFDVLHVDARGSVEALDLDASASSDLGTVTLAGTTDRSNGNWRATVRTLRLAPVRGSAWQLTSPARIAQSGGTWRIGNACLAATDGGTLCARGTWPTGLDIEGRGVPLALVTPYLPDRSDGRPWLLHGEFALDAHVRSAGNGWRGTARLASAAGGLKNSVRARNDLVDYRDLVLDASFDPQRINATLGAELNQDGRLDATLATGWDGYAPLSGEVHLRTDELTWVELLSPDIVEPTGTLAGHVTFGGTRAAPTIGGTAQLTDFSTEIPALAIHPTNGNVRLDALPDGTARITGKIDSGDGTLNIDGSLGWNGNDTPLVLNVKGANVLAADTRELRAVVNPDVVVRYAAGQPLDISGTVVVPSATIDLERLDRGAKVSDDVVILDPVDPEEAQGLATPLALDLTLELGEDVVLNGFGLDGTLDGSLNVRQVPGRAMVASGELDVGGEYRAYGQELEITRGRLVWQGSPIADPLLDVSAKREVGDVVAGITVTGRASRPQADVWTDPATDQSQALAYLALGRPLATANGDESRQLDAASAALSAGGSLIASQLGARLGLDDAGVIDSRTLGGSVLGVGKYLSPKLYVGYGVSLLGTGQVLTLKYLLRAGFDIEIESSTVENRASVNWRLER